MSQVKDLKNLLYETSKGQLFLGLERHKWLWDLEQPWDHWELMVSDTPKGQSI